MEYRLIYKNGMASKWESDIMWVRYLWKFFPDAKMESRQIV